MPGLPLGAAQQHDIPAELLCYEHIEGIEYIQTRAGIPYPRSAAYRRIEGGAQVRVRDEAPELIDIELDEEEARSYIERLRESGLFAWNRVYRPAQGTFMFDGTNWRVEVTFAKAGTFKRPRPFRAEGELFFPDGYEDVVGALMGVPDSALERAGLLPEHDAEADRG